jgi:integrase
MAKLLVTLNLCMEEIVDRGVIDRNPLEGMAGYSQRPLRPRGAIPREALDKLFPAAHRELVQVWGSAMWAACMCLLADTGLRPGEARALRWREVDSAERFIAVRHGVEAGTRDKIKGTKTGIVRAAFISYRTAQELAIWRSESPSRDPEHFIFTINGESPVRSNHLANAFAAGKRYIGRGDEPWTPYWLRHSFGTYHLAELDDTELLLLMGHTNIVTNQIYRHPDDEVMLRRSRRLRDKLDAERE